MPEMDGSLLSDDEFNALQAIADRFAEARKQGPIDDWELLLPLPDAKLRRPALIECSKIDLEYAWKSEGGQRGEYYPVRFPELNGVPIELIVEEYRVRHLFGDKPPLDDYAVRFPDQYAEFEKRIEKLIVERSAPKFAKSASGPTPSLASLFPTGYRPGEILGRGNFAEVWRAEAPGGIAIAIKIVTQPLDNDAAQREQQSLELVKKLQHPALLSTTAFWIIQNRLVIAMELADGSLRDRLQECKSRGLKGIPAEELLSYFRDVATGLDWLHWQGVLHRDIKPENILLMKGYAKVADFGLARANTGKAAMMSVSFAGTPAFMPPEMWSGKAGPRSDQYSLAFTYAELRMGRRPLEGDDFVQVMTSAIEGEPDLEGVPPAEQTVLRRALAKRPEERFETCEEFVEALERAIHPHGGGGRWRPKVEAITRGSEPAEGSSTERTEHKLTKPKQVLGTTDKTLQQQTVPPNKQSKWPKTPGPAPTQGSGLRLVVVVLLVLALAGGGAGIAYVVFFMGGGSNPSSQSEQTSSKIKPVSTTSKPEIVAPPVKKPLKPDRFAPAADPKDIGDEKYYERIVFGKGDGEVAFKLLKDGIQPFYLMETKAPNALFAAFRIEKPADEISKWKDNGPRLPAFNVTWDEATKCAAWLGGRLPTPEELDFALSLGMLANPAVGLKNPRPVTEDRSGSGIFDLTGNGREWTSSTFKLKDEDFATLRGRMFTLAKPAGPEQLKDNDLRNAQVQRTKVASPFTTFRVAIDLPKKKE
jgi:serine/threonine protein kinase